VPGAAADSCGGAMTTLNEVENAMNDPSLPVEHYVDGINAICTQLEANQGELARYSVVAALKKLDPHDDLDDRGDDGDQTWGAVAAALDYYQREDDQGEEWLQGYGSFGPMVVMPADGGGSTMYPAEPARLPGETREVWRALAEVENLDPLVRGRLSDLLWELGDGPRPHAHAEAAVSCYIAHLRRESAEPCGREESGRRAATLATTLNNPQLISESLDAIEHLVARSLDTAADEFGIVARGLQTLIDHTQASRNRRRDAGPDERDARVRALMERSLQVYRHPDRQQELLNLALRAVEDEQEAQQLRDRQIEVAESAAEGCEGLLALARLDDARRLAARHGDRDAESRIRRQIEETDMSNAFSEISTEIQVDNSTLRRWVEALMRSGQDPAPPLGPAIMLLQYGIHGVPVAPPDESREAVAELQAKHPLLTLCNRHHIGPHNSVSITVGGGALRALRDLGEHDAFAINMFAVTFARLFMEEMRQQFGPSGEEMASWLAAAGIPMPLAERIGVSHERWAAGDYVSAVSVLVLVVEGAVRHLADRRGIPVTTTRHHDGGEQVSELRPLGQLIKALGADEAGAGPGALPAAHVRYLEAALVDRWSLNLRNILAHDAEAALDEPTYCVLFHIVCLLAMHTAATDRPGSSDTGNAGPEPSA